MASLLGLRPLVTLQNTANNSRPTRATDPSAMPVIIPAERVEAEASGDVDATGDEKVPDRKVARLDVDEDVDTAVVGIVAEGVLVSTAVKEFGSALSIVELNINVHSPDETMVAS